MRRFFRREAGLGDEREWMGNTVRPILFEQVDQEWRDGEVVSERCETKDSGKLALVVPRGGLR
jgi:hypothetical protein